MKPVVTDADKAMASRLMEELDAAGKLADTRKALHTVLCESLATIRALSARSARKATAKGNKLTLPDGTVIRAQKSGAALAIHMTEPGKSERQLLSYGGRAA